MVEMIGGYFDSLMDPREFDLGVMVHMLGQAYFEASGTEPSGKEIEELKEFVGGTMGQLFGQALDEVLTQ